ncbi:MAG: hypothetical protein ACTHM8_03545 [Sphingomonas sp.]
MIALLIGYESVSRLPAPVPIHFSGAISIAMLDLCVNLASAWLPSGDHDHGHSRSHGGHYDHADDEAGARQLSVGDVAVTLSIHEDCGPSRFRLVAAGGGSLPSDVSVQTIRPDGARQRFSFADRGGYLKSGDEIPEPHAFIARVTFPTNRPTPIQGTRSPRRP